MNLQDNPKNNVNIERRQNFDISAKEFNPVRECTQKVFSFALYTDVKGYTLLIDQMFTGLIIKLYSFVSKHLRIELALRYRKIAMSRELQEKPNRGEPFHET